jgi:hypothetical protein
MYAITLRAGQSLFVRRISDYFGVYPLLYVVNSHT